MKWISALLTLSILVFILQIILFFSNIFKPFDVIYVILAAFAAISTVLAAKEGYSPTNKKILKLFTIGLLFWTLGDFSWMYYELVLGVEVPFPSLADLFWSVGYIPVLYAMFLRRKELFVSKRRRIATSILSLILLLIPFTLISSAFEGKLNLTFMLGISYVIYDYLVVMLALDVLLTAATGQFIKPWIILAIGFSVRTMFDYGFAFFTHTGTYHTGHPIDLLWSLSYLLITVSAFYRTNSLIKFKQKFTIPAR